jgi:alkanesulfonate monooxygenase SsuD/methylene tetrahydromethanopterin reductase-like flavin-dependent oxidoreductase (luciferase family)
MNRIGSSRGWSAYTKMQYEGGRSKEGALFIGNSDEVAEKINMVKEMFGLTRYIAHMDIGAPNHEVMMKSIESFGTKVAEKVR